MSARRPTVCIRLGRWLPSAGLVLALSTVFLFSGDRERFYRSYQHDFASAKTIAHAENLSPTRLFLFHQMTRRADGTIRYDLYNRFPLGGFALIKFATLPFQGDLAAQIRAARWLMLAFFSAAAVLAYCALARLVAPLGTAWRDNPAAGRLVAAAACLCCFSSYPLLRYCDMISTEGSVDLFAVMLVFHGLVLFRQEGRFGQLLAKVCVALLLGWHAFALLLSYLGLTLAGEVVNTWRGAGHSVSFAAFCKRALRSRHARLAIVAGLFGVGVLGFQFATERMAFDGERELAELPSVKSMVKRFGGNPTVNAMLGEQLDWWNFVALQFHRVGASAIPYVVPTPRNEFGELPWGAPGDPSLAWMGVGVTALCFGGLWFAPRARLLLGALAASGFLWVFGMRHQTAELAHGFEGMYFVGAALVFFTLLLTGAAKVTTRPGGLMCGFAVAAAAVFGASSWSMSAAGADSEAAAIERAMMVEYETVRAVTRGKDVLVAANEVSLQYHLKAPSRMRSRHWSVAVEDGSAKFAFHYYMAGSYLRYADRLDRLPMRRRPDFVLGFERFALPSLRTPTHKFVFLYDSLDALDAMVAARRRDYSVIAAERDGWALQSRSDWRVYAKPAGSAVDAPLAVPELALLKAPCALADTNGRFFLQVRPAHADDGFADLYMGFGEQGVAFDDKCLLRLALPRRRIGTVRAGQFAPGRGPLLWRTAFYLDSKGLRDAYRSVQGHMPAARGAFAVHRRDGRLIYVREPCVPVDAEPRFFLHVVPANAADLPPARRSAGFLSLDFDFRERGELQGDRCVALVPLPDYAINAMRTGQFAPARGELWRVEVEPADAQ